MTDIEDECLSQTDRQLLARLDDALVAIEELGDFRVLRRFLLEHFARAVATEEICREWANRFVALAEHKVTHAMADPMRGDDGMLLAWVAEQRENYHADTLPARHVEFLKAIGSDLAHHRQTP